MKLYLAICALVCVSFIAGMVAHAKPEWWWFTFVAASIIAYAGLRAADKWRGQP